MRFMLCVAALLAANPARAASSAQPLAVWTELTRDGALQARIVTRDRCPQIELGDGKRIASLERAAPGRGFDVRTCEAQLPRGTSRAEVLGHALPVPPRTLRRVAVLGDSGCRILLILFQGCNDPAAWPFPSIAQRIAASRPDLVVHVGDYYYRETPCLIPECAGSPYGDSWTTWLADFFAPAAPLLATAPLVAVRGNHEICRRGGPGWDRFLSVYPYGRCVDHEPGYATGAGGLRFFVVDSANARDDRPDPAVARAFDADFSALRALPPARTWLLVHRPMWEVAGTIAGGVTNLNATLDASEGEARTLPVELVLSGHVHLFEALQFADGRPPQVGVGNGGAVLTRAPFRVAGEAIDGTTVSAGIVRHDFGYAIFDLEKRTLEVYDRLGSRLEACRWGPGELSCAA
ncbi:MAG: metallophosphoesterase [Candidatus Eremiobacteraeota bacterium]|nr:metallophosphoesterase [Candidatus Eremiobacteraeota bacterium]